MNKPHKRGHIPEPHPSGIRPPDASRTHRVPSPVPGSAARAGRSDTSGHVGHITPPTVTAVDVRRTRVTRVVVIKCPHCGRRHEHGWGYGDDADPGHRLAHCHAPAGYRITVPKDLR